MFQCRNVELSPEVRIFTTLLWLSSFVVFSNDTTKSINHFDSPSEKSKADKTNCTWSFGQLITFIEYNNFIYDLNLNEYAFGVRSFTLNIGEQFANRLREGEPYAILLKKIGFYLKIINGKEFLVPPDSLLELTGKLNQLMDQAAEGIATDYKPAHFALSFQNRTDHSKQVFIRPGVDPLPDLKQWELGISRLVPSEAWAKAISEGKLPVNIKLLHHDLTHATDGIEDPEYMYEISKFYTHAAPGTGSLPIKRFDIIGSNSSVFSKESWQSLDPQQRTRESENAIHMRLFLLGEFLAVPNLKKTNQIKAMIPHYFSGPPPSIPTVRVRLNHLATTNRAAYVQYLKRFSSKFNSVTTRLGGNIKDGMAGYVATDRDAVIDADVFEDWLQSAARNEGLRTTGTRSDIGDSYRSNPYGMNEMLSYIVERFDNLESYISKNTALINRVLNKPSTHRPTQAEAVIVLSRFASDLVSRLENFLYAGVRENITPAQIVRDSRVDYMDPNSPTYRFMSSFSIPNSAYHNAFVRPVRIGN